MKNFWLKVPTGEIIHNGKCKLKNKFFLQFKFNLRLILFVPWKGCSPCCGGGARRESLTSPPSPSQSADWDPVALENSPGKSVIYQGKSAKSSNWWGGGGRFTPCGGGVGRRGRVETLSPSPGERGMTKYSTHTTYKLMCHEIFYPLFFFQIRTGLLNYFNLWIGVLDGINEWKKQKQLSTWSSMSI